MVITSVAAAALMAIASLEIACDGDGSPDAGKGRDGSGGTVDASADAGRGGLDAGDAGGPDDAGRCNGNLQRRPFEPGPCQTLRQSAQTCSTPCPSNFQHAHLGILLGSGIGALPRSAPHPRYAVGERRSWR